MATLAYDQDAPGRGGSGGPLRGMGPNKIATGTFAFDSSYPTGGESVSGIWDLFKSVQGLVFFSRSGYVFDVDYTNKKVLAYYSDYDAGADGALIQVPDTTNLSTVTGVRWMAWGRV